MPPGFKDAGKPDENKFGDLLLWKQLLKKAAMDKRPVMLVTDDRKEDWWRRHEGKTIGPHPSLISEITTASGQPFHMYQPDRFVEFGFARIQEPAEKALIAEVKAAHRPIDMKRLERMVEVDPSLSVVVSGKGLFLLNESLNRSMASLENKKRELEGVLQQVERLRVQDPGSDEIGKLRAEAQVHRDTIYVHEKVISSLQAKIHIEQLRMNDMKALLQERSDE